MSFLHEDATSWNEARLEEYLVRQAHRPFDLEQGPLWRAHLLTRSTHEHVLSICLHHISVDFWSLVVLMDELGQLYAAENPKLEEKRLPPPTSYLEFAQWQNQMLSSDIGQEHERYWQQQLAGNLPVLDLPIDHPRPATQTHRGASHSFQLDQRITQSLWELAKQEEVTLYTLLLSAFQALLCRYTGQTDVVVGSPVAGRSRAGFEKVVGYFANMVVMRGDLSEDPTFTELLSRTRKTVLEALAHQDFPFALLVDRLEQARDPSRSPIFQTVFVLEKPHMREELAEFVLGESGATMALGELQLESLALEQRVAQFDLTFMMVETSRGLGASIQYNSDLFETSTISRMANHFQTLVEGVLSNPGQRLSELPLLSSEEQRLLAEWKGAAGSVSPETSLQGLFEDQVSHNPEVVALVLEDQQVTYRELNIRANQLARYLKKLGVGPEVLVGICMDRSLEMIVAILGILKAGGAYFPLDPNYPEERLSFMLQDGQVSLVLCKKPWTQGLPPEGTQVLALDSHAAEISRESIQNPPPSSSAENLAYVMYTSGSTGVPNGVAVCQRSIIRLVQDPNYVELSADDVVLQFAPHTFDAATFEVWASLLHGGKLVLLHHEKPSLEQLSQALARHRISTLWLTSGLFHQMVDHELDGLRSVRQLLAGGDVLSVPHVQKVLDHVPSCRLINGYGPTENTTFTCCHPLEGNQALASSSVPIGRPINGTQVFVLTGHLQPVPVGVTAELIASGTGLARGYLGRPALTAEKFVPGAFSEQPGSRLYKTGDLVRYLEDGSIEFVGRVDDQLKVRGFRVETGEIEIVLTGHPAVRESVVVAEQEATTKRLVAYLVAEPAAPSASQLRDYLRERLPEYMVPAVFMTLDSLPLTANGKVDRRGLPAPGQTRPELDNQFVTPQQGTEAQLAEIWSELLGVERVGRYDDFFELGGHSLIGTQVISRVRQVTGVDLPLRSLFENPTVAGLAKRIGAARQGEENGPEAHPLLRTARDAAPDLSFTQERLWFLAQLVLGEPIYNIPAAIRLEGLLNVAALEQALEEIRRRHEVLRMGFLTVDGRPVPVVRGASACAAPMTDLRGLSGSARSAAMQGLTRVEALRAFDAAEDPLIRFSLVKTGQAEHVLFITMHHIVSDGWSIGILIRELGMLYDAFCSGKASQLAELSIEYRDFAHWQREWLQGPALDEQLDYWKQALAGVKPELELPIDRRRPALPSYKGSVCSVVLPPDLVEALHAFGQRHGFTLFMILLGALKIFLARLTKQDDLVVGTVTSGRTRAETESLIGCFMNFLPLRSRLSGDETGLCFLQQVRTSVLDADAHQECPFQKIVEAVQPDRSSSQNPLFNVAFLLENYPRSDFSSDTLKAVPLPPDRQISLLDLRFVASESATETLFSCEYSTDLFDVQTIQLLLDSFRSTLEKLVHEPETKVRSFPLSEALGVKAEPETVAITATFTAEPVEESLAFWAGKLEVPFKTEFAPYGQVFQELLAPDSLFAANQKGLNVVLVRLEDWEKSYTRLLPKVSPGEKERILADQARFTLPNRVEIAHLNRYETEYLYEEIFVDQVYLKHGIELRDGDCVFDVGANIGLFTLFVQQRLQNATIHAFEPAPHTFEILRTNAELYGQNINLHHCGLADEDKTATFTFYPRSSVFSSFHAGTGHDTDAIRAVVLNAMKKADSGNGDSLGAFAEEFLPDRLASQEFTTQLRTLSGVVRENNIDQIDLLKIDVKRSELAVLHGIDIHTWKVIKQVVIEVHDPEGPLLNEVIRLLRTNGFEAEVEEEELLQGSGLFNIYATRRGRDTTDFQKQEPEPPDAVELQKKVEELIHAVGTAAQTGVTPHLVCICPASPAARMDPERSQRYERMEEFLASGLEGVAGVTVLKPAQLAAAYPVADYFDPHADELGHIPYTREFFASLGTSIARHMSATKAPPRKVIVLDCDQTLWKGVCAEDGAEGVAIDPPRRALQEFMLAQHDAGKLLCLCSKNSEMDVADVFDRHSEMPLRRDHFVSWRVNWHPKSENIRSLSEELQLGLDSFIFIDDSPIECAEVRSAFPEVLTLQLPEVPEQIPVFLNHVWAFDQVETTAEDKRRTALYRQNVQRERARKKSLTFADFLTDLNLDVRIDKMSALQLSRVSQLSHRTNQFNVSKQARSESELETICKRSDIECLTVQVTDRFGDYGLVGVLLFQHDAGQIAVDTFLLSCRVLGRGVEHRMLARLGEIATRQGLTQICIPWNPNGRNQPALTFLNSLGAQHRQSRGESFDFLIPASHTLDVTFQPDVVVTRDPVDVSEKRPAAAADQVWNSARQLLAEVGLFDVERILKAIETDKRIRTRSRRKVAFVAPRNEVERLISGVWEQLLQLDQVGIHDHFFDMGGHSLLATQALSRLCDAFQVNLPLQSVFDSPTVAAMASTIARARVEGEGRATPPVKRLGQQDELPLSFAQERLWFLDQLEPGSHLYNVPVVLRLTGRLNSALLQGALAQILRRHEVLRTSFTSVDGRPQQVILESPPLPFRLIDLRRVSRADVRPWVVEEAQRLFDLTQGPLLRAALLKMADDEHVVVLTMHHIVSDGWSSGVLAHELAALYEGLSEGLPSRLPELPVQYKDFTVWQRKWLDGARLESELSYWKEQLKMAPPALNLPTDFPRPAVPSYRGHAISRRLPESLCEALAELARQERVTSFMTLLAAFQVMLSRHTSQDDIVVGTTIANRMRPELEGLVGFFANTLPLRLKLEGNPPFQDVLRQVRHMTLEAYAHQDLPFEKLVEAVQPDRDMNRTPIFQVAFELQNALSETLPLPGLQVELEPIATLTAKYDLSLFVVDSDGRLNLRIEYNTDLFGPASVNSFLERFEILLGAVVDDPQRPISDLPLLSKGARQQLLQDWNKTAVELPAEPLIHRRFEVQVQETPDAVAIVSKDQQLTYRELNTKANQLAHHLQMEGVGPDVLVGIYMERAPEMVVGLLGVLKVGGAYLPLDPSYPQERLRFMLEDSKASIVLTQEHLQVGLPKTSAAVHSLDSEWTDLRKHGEENLTSPVTHGNLAYAIYTSGSTGRPKGAMIEHRAIANHMNWMCRNFPLSDKDAVLQKTPISFDASVWEFYAPLLSGARLVLARPNGHQDVDYLFTAMEKHGVTTLQVVPTLLRVMLQQSDQRSCRSLKRFFCGGELLAAELRDLFFDRFDAELHNLYGPTETCIESTVWSCERGKARSAVPIGRPIDNTQVYLLDTALNPIPVGVPGEVHIAGLGVGRGYWNRSNLTAERFIPNPFSHEPGDRMYGTGDLALYRPDGTIEFLGRRDHQTKVRGFRIELGEIEALLGRQPGVRETVVAAREDRPGDQRLVAYFTVESQSSSSIRTLRRALQDQLPDFMVPSSFVLLDALPLTANGKVDRRALPVPRMDRSELEEDYVAPGSDDEKKLADIVAEVLALDRVGAHDNFFELGGHSLLATKVVSRINVAFRTQLPLRRVFEFPTVSGLARSLRGVVAEGELISDIPMPPLQRITGDGPLPLSFAQQRLWFLDQMDPGNPYYNMAAALHLRGNLNVSALERAIGEIIRRHEVLQTSYILHEAQPAQVRITPDRLTLPVVDLSSLPEASWEDHLQLLAAVDARRHFDLAKGKVLRATLVRGTDSEQALLFAMHHIVSDGWSLGVVVRELSILYEAYCGGRPSELTELPIQYVDFAHWQRQWLQDDVLQSQLSYWKTRLGGQLPTLELRTDRPRPAVETFRGADEVLVIPKALTKELKNISARENVTLFMTLLAAYKTLLLRNIGQDDVVVGTDLAGRNHVELEGLIGFFVNLLVLRTDLSGNPSFRGLLKRVRQTTMGALAHQEMPFDRLVEELQPARHRSRTPLFQILFVMENVPMETLDLPGLTFKPLQNQSNTARFDLGFLHEKTVMN